MSQERQNYHLICGTNSLCHAIFLMCLLWTLQCGCHLIFSFSFWFNGNISVYIKSCMQMDHKHTYEDCMQHYLYVSTYKI